MQQSPCGSRCTMSQDLPAGVHSKPGGLLARGKHPIGLFPHLPKDVARAFVKAVSGRPRQADIPSSSASFSVMSPRTNGSMAVILINNRCRSKGMRIAGTQRASLHSPFSSACTITGGHQFRFRTAFPVPSKYPRNSTLSSFVFRCPRLRGTSPSRLTSVSAALRAFCKTGEVGGMSYASRHHSWRGPCLMRTARGRKILTRGGAVASFLFGLL